MYDEYWKSKDAALPSWPRMVNEHWFHPELGPSVTFKYTIVKQAMVLIFMFDQRDQDV